MYAQVYESQRRFQRACDQLMLLNDRMKALRDKYSAARAENQKLFRYKLRMRIMVLEGFMAAYYNYACLKKNEVLDLRFKLYGEDPSDGEALYSGFVLDRSDDDDDHDHHEQ